MINYLKKVNSEDSLLTKAYRAFYWNFYWKIITTISDAYHWTYRFFCEIVNSEVPFSKSSEYYRWLLENYPRKDDLKEMDETINLFTYQPLISIIIPVYNTPEDFLREMLDSVLAQVYPHWELCICDDASPLAHVQEVLSAYAAKDTRIKIAVHQANKHISHTSNSAIDIATGEFISLLDHDDLITPDALYEIVALLNQHPEADMIYSDEDKIIPDRSLEWAFFKQDWCPDSFLARMYICHLATYRLSIVQEIGGFRPGYEGSQDYDLMLRFMEKTDKIFHIPKILYHWRIHPESTSGGIEAKPYAINAAKQALSDAISRRGEFGVVIPIVASPGHYTIRYQIKEHKLVSIIIADVNSAKDLDRSLNSIFSKSLYPNYEVVIFDNSKKQDISNTVARWSQQEPNRCKLVSIDDTLNYSESTNHLVSQTIGDYILFLHSTLEVITPDWIEALVEQAQRSSIGAAGASILTSDNKIAHAGIILESGVIKYSHRGLPSTDNGYFECVAVVNNYSAVSLNCLMCKRSVFDSVGGFDRDLYGELAGVDLCLKMIDKGYKNVYLPHAVLCDWGSQLDATQVEGIEMPQHEMKYFQKKWQNILDRDPCHNPNLILENGNCVIKTRRS